MRGRLNRLVRFAPLFLTALLLMAPLLAHNLPRVVAILSTDAAPYHEHLERFQKRLSARVESFTLAPETKGLAGLLEKNPPDLILALGSKAADFAAGLKIRSPVVFSMVYDPASDGLPSGPNQCGLALQIPVAARLKALEALRPGPNAHLRFGALHDPKAGRRELDELKRTLEDHKYSLVVKEISDSSQLDKQLEDMLPQIDVLWILFEPSLIPDEDVFRDHVLRPAVDAGVAVVGLSDPHVQKGALLAVSVDFQKEGEHAANIAQRVLAGESPQKIGVEPPEYVIWSLNLNVAREIGWEVPPLVRKRFERIY